MNSTHFLRKKDSMNRKLLLSVMLMMLYIQASLATSFFDKPFKTLGDSIPCILFLELEQADNGDYIVSLLPDTSWTFPRNIVSTAQVTVKVPTGGFVIGEISDLIDGVTFFQSGRNNTPIENPLFDYLSFSLGTQGTSRIPFQKGEKVALFSFNNTGICPDGVVQLMNNFTDPFYPPNSAQTNAGQQITVSGFGAPDLPIGIRGTGISCNPTDPNPVDTTNMPVDTTDMTPVDTTSMPVDTTDMTPIDTTSMPIDTMDMTPVDTTSMPVDTTDNGSTPPFSDSDLTAQFAVQNISCTGANDGIIVLKTEKGVPPYNYTWSNGATTSSIENLLPGTYTVQIRDQTGFIIEHTVIITEPNVLNLQISKTNASQAGAANGIGRAIVTGGIMPYSYAWSNGATTGTQNNLAEGTYALTVTDANGCTDEKSINIIDQSQCVPINVLLDMKSPICSGESNGQILVTPQGGQAPFSYVWENGNGTNFIQDINTGLYMVTVTDGIGCTMAVSAMLPDATPLIVNLDVVESGAMNGGQIFATVEGGTGPYTYSWNNGGSEPVINNLAGGVYMLSLTDNQGCEKVVSEVITSMSCELGKLDAFDSAIVLDEIPCNDKGSICIPIPLDSMVNYSIFLDGEDYSSNLKGCQFETFFAYSYAFFASGNAVGNYNLREWLVNGTTYSGAFTSVDALVDSMNIWDPTGNWVNLKEISIIQGGTTEQVYGSMVIVEGAVSTILDVNSNLTPVGTEISFKSGIHQLVLVNNTTVCSDTLRIDQPCSGERRDSLITITINIGDQTSFCLEPMFGTDIQVGPNTCPDLSGIAAGIVLDAPLNCLRIEGVLAGTEEACFEIIDANGGIIDVTVIVIVKQETTIPCTDFQLDTIFAFAPNCNQLQICTDLPFDILNGAVITNNTLAYTGTIAACGNNGTSFTFAQSGLHNLSISYGDNCIQEVVIILACDADQVIEETIEIGTFDVVCLSVPGLLGTFETVENLCPEKSGTNALFEVLGNSGCIGFTGIGMGSDTACIKVCDFFGFCDTVTLIYHVEDPTGTPPPIFDAVNDSATISLNSSIVLDILGNDVFRDLDTTYLVTEPANGQVFINPDATLTYIAQTGYCDEEQPDTFLYAICESGICDTATVAITVNCFVNRELIVYNGLSPNGDGKNDAFLIEGIENYPANQVSIFNRWGNRVLVMDGYKNEWTGTWTTGTILPDGTYFYIIDLGDGSDVLKGFLELRR